MTMIATNMQVGTNTLANSKFPIKWSLAYEKLTSRSRRPMTPTTSPAAPTTPMDSPNNKAASIATVKG